MQDHHRESRSRVTHFKSDVVDLWVEHDLSTLEYLTALTALAHDISVRLLAGERKKAWKKAQKKQRKEKTDG